MPKREGPSNVRCNEPSDEDSNLEEVNKGDRIPRSLLQKIRQN